MATIERAIAIAVEAHHGQTDKVGRPYILHPLRVMSHMTTDAEMIVAELHDVVEDCDGWTFDRLRDEGFSEEVIEALDGVTNREDEDYEAFIIRAAKNPIARRVKIADLEDNMDVRRLATVGDKDARRLSKYTSAWRTLTGAP